MRNKLIIPINSRVLAMDKKLRKLLIPLEEFNIGFFKSVLSTLQEPITFPLTPCSPKPSQLVTSEEYLVNTFRLLLINTYGANVTNDVVEAVTEIMRYIIQEIVTLLCQDTKSDTVYSVTCHIDVTDGNLPQILNGVYLPIQVDYTPIT